MTIIGSVPEGWAIAVGWLSSVITLLCVVPLCWATLKGHASPRPVTWAIWAGVGLVATVAMARGGAPFEAWLLKGALSLGPVAVALAATLAGVRWVADWSDRISLPLGLAGLVIYAFTGVGLVAVFVAIAVDVIGAVPTWRNAWRNPYDELIITYALALVSVLAVLGVLPLPWTWLSASYLCFLAVQMTSIIAVLVLARRKARHAAGPLDGVGQMTPSS